jgi:alanyl-tRNA synthetase
VNVVLNQVHRLERELSALKGKLARTQRDALLQQAEDMAGVGLVAARMEDADAEMLRESLDKLRDRLQSAIVVLASVTDEGRVLLVAGVTADLTKKVKAGELVNFVAQQVGGKGGGRPDMAQAGGTQPENLPVALASVVDWVSERLAS